MSKLQTVKGIAKTFFMLTKEDWNEMDKKFYRIFFGAVSFIIMALFYLFFFKNVIGF